MGIAVALGFAPDEGDSDESERARLERLCELYFDRVRKIVLLRLGARLRKTVASGDILQGTFLAALRSIDSFETREEASLINWLARLAERQIISAADYHGAKKRHPEVNVPPPGENPSLPLEAISSEAEQKIVEECLLQLSEEYRELILLRNYAGASWEALAEEMGLPSAAAARMKHAHAILELGKLIRARGTG